MTDLARAAGFLGFLFVLVLIPAGLMLCTFVARDMDRRGLDGRLYGALAFFCLPAGLALWLVVRASHPVQTTEER